jgi:hypothetical protein
VQVPRLVVSAHDMQVPVQAVLQQMPCSQWFEVQSPPAAHAAPVAFFPQTVAMQKSPDAQSASTAHLVLQTPVVSQA